jgi:hypothetical protein
MVDQLEGTVSQKKLIKNVAADWGTRSGFLNAVVAALVSVFVTFAGYPRAATVAALSFIVVAVPVGVWIVSHTTIGDLVKPRTENPRTIFGWEVNRTAASLCRIILIALNIALLILIYISRRWSAAP